MATHPARGRVSDMPVLPAVTGEEYLEVIARNPKGLLENFRISVEDIRTNVGLSAYEYALLEGFEGTKEEWLASLNGTSAYDLAVAEGFEGTEAEWFATLQGADGKSAFVIAQEAGYEGTEEEFGAALNAVMSGDIKQIAGAVFIRNVSPVDPTANVGNKVYANDEKTLLSCTATTRSVTVHIDAVTGNTSYKPVVKYEDRQVPLTASPTNELIWKGMLVVEDFVPNASGIAVLKFTHNDGATGSVSIVSDVPPMITRAAFTGTYPGTQTELKEGDKVSISFDVDSDIIAYEVKNVGALRAASGALEAGVTHVVDNLSVADRGNELQSLHFELRVRKAGGAWSEWYSSQIGGEVDFVNVVALNNLHPTVQINSITYPGEQTAIKGDDTASVNYTLNNYDGVISANVLGSSIEVVSVDENATVVKVAAGATSSTANNLNITLTRDANGSTTTGLAAVVVANDAPTINITLPAARLRSGGNFDTEVQSHEITLTSSQELGEAPTLEASVGTWETAGWTSNPAKTVWKRKLKIHDDDVKGIATFSGLSATSTAGITATVINSGAEYEVGGFVRRILNILRWTNRTTAIGTMVVDTSKLLCSNLSKGQENSYNTKYKADDANEENRYTIKDGNTWYNCDVANAVANTQDAAYIDIEETV